MVFFGCGNKRFVKRPHFKNDARLSKNRAYQKGLGPAAG
jgi:hypothetical protein